MPEASGHVRTAFWNIPNYFGTHLFYVGNYANSQQSMIESLAIQLESATDHGPLTDHYAQSPWMSRRFARLYLVRYTT